MTTPIRKIVIGENHRSVSVLNRPVEDILSGSGYSSGGEDFAGFATTATSAGKLNVYAVTSGEVGVTNTQYPVGHFRRYGAVLDGVTDDLAAVTKAMTAAALKLTPVTSDPGVCAISGMVSIPSGVSVLLPGGALNNVEAAFIFKCTAAGAGVTIATSGGIVQGFTVDGNNIATNCCRWVGGAGRTIINVHSHNAAQDNIIFKVAQNWTVIGCETQLAARDNLVIDDGLGGVLFSRFESNQAGRYTLLVDQSVAPTGGYAVPTHITFQHSLFEYLPGGGAADNPTIKGLKGTTIRFQDCVLTGVNAAAPTSPVVDFTGGGTWSFRDCDLTPLANPIGYRVGASTTLELDGGSGTASISSGFIDSTAGGLVRVGRAPGLGGPLKTAGTPESAIFATVLNEQRPTGLTTGSIVETGGVSGEAGARWRRFANGDYFLGSGADYAFGAGFQRFGDGTLQLLSTNVIGTNAPFFPGAYIRFKQYTTAARPSVPGAGGTIYDSDLSQLLVADGTKFRAVGLRLVGSATLNFAAPGAVPGSVDLTITVTGAALGDRVTVAAPVTVGANYLLSGFVSSANTVTVRWTQIAGAAADPDGAGGTYKVDVWQN